MARSRDPFMTALRLLRDRAVSAAFRPGRPIIILDEAQAIGLSTTPVREALAWLGGEGLVERGAAGGYLGLRADPPLIAGRYRMRMRCLLAAIDETAPVVAALSSTPGAVLDDIAVGSGDAILVGVYAAMQEQLAPVVAVEGTVLGEYPGGLEAIAEARASGDVERLKATLEAYHLLRIDAAPLLAAELVRRTSDLETR